LLDRVWQGRIVDENRLAGEIAALRKAFGNDRELIRTVTGRGYQFTGETRAGLAGGGVRRLSEAERPCRLTNLAEAVSELIGRDSELAEVTDLMTSHRLVTLIGEGGIGKTRLGVEAVRHLLGEFPDGVWIAELAPLSDPDLVPAAIATALRLDLSGGRISVERVANALRGKRLMLLLDNCEHIVAAAAETASSLLHANAAARVVATSREPLRIEGECLYRVPPLAVPLDGIWDVEELLRHGSVRLFVARARTADPHFAPEGRVAAATAAICRRLDGIPLAIELAAARSAALGIAEVASRLDDRFHLLTDGHRTALPRHQTLRATLDWSYELLSKPERVVLRRLAIFAGRITLEAAGAVAANGEVTEGEVVDCVASLITKSLLASDGDDAVAYYRLLETTRAYAFEKLLESGEADAVARRHAAYYRQLCEKVEAEAETTSAVDNVRTALRWAFSSKGDASLGIALTVACVPLWTRLSLMEECRARVECALACIEPGSSPDPRQKMLLYVALGASLMHTKGPVSETSTAWTTALELAEGVDDTEYRARALWGLYGCRIASGDGRSALAHAQQFRALAANSADPSDVLIGDKIIGFVLHYLGDQAGARLHIERMLNRYVAPAVRSHTIRFQFDQPVTARCTLSRILWVQGFPDHAIRTVQRAVEDARVLDHALSLCHVLAEGACPVAQLLGDMSALERFAAMLHECSARLTLAIFHKWARIFEATLLIARTDVVCGLELLRTVLSELREAGVVMRYTFFLGVLAEGLGRIGRTVQGMTAVDEALATSERHEERWCMPELLRIKGGLVLLQRARDASAVTEDYFRQALNCARQQGALSWELRAATSLAMLWRDEGRIEAAHQLLVPIYDRFTEGFATADLRAAEALINDFR
jgi:predicted ATPase